MAGLFWLARRRGTVLVPAFNAGRAPGARRGRRGRGARQAPDHSQRQLDQEVVYWCRVVEVDSGDPATGCGRRAIHAADDRAGGGGGSGGAGSGAGGS